MKKTILILVIIFVLTGCSLGTTYKEGVYEGQGVGYYENENPIKLSVTIGGDGKIKDIKVLDHGESQDIGQAALDQLIKNVIDDNHARVKGIDFVSNATKTSIGFEEALLNALEKSKK